MQQHIAGGFKVIPWPELKKAVLALPKIQEPTILSSCEKIISNEQFIESSIKTLDALPPAGPHLTAMQKRQRLTAKPYYDRLLKYYYIRIQLIEA